MTKRTLATAAVLAGLLASAAPAHAGTSVGNPGKQTEAAKNEVSIETLEIVRHAPRFNLPEVGDEVLL